MENKSLKRYLTQLRRALTCSRADRERLLAQGRQLVEDFEEENPGSPYAALTAAFGQPKDFAAEMLSQLDPGEVEKARKRRKYIRRGAGAAILIILALLSVFWYFQYKKSQSWNENAIIVIEPAKEMTEEEYQQYWNDIQEGVEVP